MKEKIVDIIDTSSRISDEELEAFLSEMKAILGAHIEVIECDTKVENKGNGKAWGSTLKAYLEREEE